MDIDRRTFLVAGLAGAAGARRLGAQAPPLVTLSDWLQATAEARQRALPAVLDRIRTLDPSIQAWVQVAPQRPTATGPLAEIPFAAKEIIETLGLSTEYGSAVYKGRLGTFDAAIIRDLRQRGAILLGKTVSTAFAYKTPGPTRNPRNLEYTPGGSSSGSAAAVAANMVPFALGTQTRGSILRPASYCGITGFKPTFGLLPMEGVLPFSESLDTLGLFTHTAADMLRLWEALGRDIGAAEETPIGVPVPMPDVEPEMAAAVRGAVAQLQRAGADIRFTDVAPLLASLDQASNTVMFYEAARYYETRYNEFGLRLGQDLYDLVRDGLRLPAREYDAARRVIERGRSELAAVYRSTPIVIVPAATGPAPRGLVSTGDARINAPWTALGTPAISIPMRVTGLPLGLQLTADRGQDARLLRASVRFEKLLT